MQIVHVGLILGAVVLAGLAEGQQGGFGGGGGLGGGGFGGQGGQGGQLGQMAATQANLDGIISSYLNGDEVKNVLTPGEYCEWKLDMKAGQVVLAEARSDAFDPALEIVDSANKVLASNDDRYPGDQRPLLLWRCEHDGPYAIHVRCFHDKSRGQFFLRFQTYESVDLAGGPAADHRVKSGAPLFVRVPMAKGEIVQQVIEQPSDNRHLWSQIRQVIDPNGLPDMLGLTHPIQPAFEAFMAPAAGDYYFLEQPFGPADGQGYGQLRITRREVVAKSMAGGLSGSPNSASVSGPTLCELSVRAGDLLEAATPELYPYCHLIVTDEPDLSKYDVDKPESNPWYPHPEKGDSSVLDRLPKRARDNRFVVFRARKDAKVWIATDGFGPPKGNFAVSVFSAARPFSADASEGAKLRIGDTDYWAFLAKAGDVMTFKSEADGFAERVDVRDPDLEVLRHDEAPVDQPTDSWRLIVHKPGTYLVGVGCLGDGGGGAYSLARREIHPSEFGLGKAAKGSIDSGQVQAWRFTATPDRPLLVHWTSSTWTYSVDVTDDKGGVASIPLQMTDGHNEFGILQVAKATTFVIVLTGTGAASYSIDVAPLPGYGK